MNKWCIYISLLLLLIASSCSYEEYPEPDGSNPPTQQGDGSEVTFRLTFTGEDEGLDTRSISEVSENKIDSLHLYIFKPSEVAPNNRLADTLMYTVKATDITNSGSTPFPVKTAKAKFKSLPAGQRFIMIANKPTTMALNYIEGKTTLAEFMPQLKFAASAWQDGSTMVDGSFTPFPMFGQSTKFRYVGAAISGLDPYPGTIDVAMVRSMAKVQLRVDINNNTGDPALGGASYFRIDSVFVCNYADSGYIAPYLQHLITDSIPPVTQTNSLRPTQVKNIGYKFPTSVAHTVPFLNNTIYVTERDSSYLILKAYYYDQLCYYRVDFVKGEGTAPTPTNIKPVLRNHVYNFVITGLRTKGFNTMGEAQAAIFPVMNPHLILDNTAADITDIVYNRDNFLGLSSTIAKFDWMGAGNGATSYGVPPIEITVRTMQDMPAPVVTGISPATTYSWSTTGLAKVRTLSINRPNRNLSTGTQTETLVLTTTDNLQQTIKIQHYAGPYSYMVGTANNTINIPVASAMAYGRTSLAPADFNNKEVAIVYVHGTPPTTPNFAGSSTYPITSVNNIFTVSTGDMTGGYFIIVLRDVPALGPNPKIYWSWMVWPVESTSAGPSVTAGTTYGYTGRPYIGPTYTFNSLDYMYWDLGVHTQFQWGRKDALLTPGSHSMYNSAPAHILCNVDTANANPFTFYYNNVSPFDWKRDWQNNNLWVDVDGEKGPYDPCPFGWRVPPAENDSVFPLKGYGSTAPNTTNGLMFVATGAIDGLTGTLIAAVNPAHYWTASARSTQALSFLTYGLAYATPQNAYRANGYSIRCVRDNIRKLK
jgi:hypothetical protein